MLNKMSLLLAATVVALSGVAAGAANLSFSDGNRHHGGGSSLSIDIGSVAFGYNDGYWDTGHRWHKWRNSAERQNYRSHGQNFHNYGHNRNTNHGWLNR
ncbi:MAG TPA: hypothetical protein VGB91_13930 [Rhizomicrobium sp.]